jgi:hypothetical protein
MGDDSYGLLPFLEKSIQSSWKVEQYNSEMYRHDFLKMVLNYLIAASLL